MKNANTLVKILSHLGIVDGPQDIYLCLLRDGEATARVIAQRTGIIRTTIYDHMRLLQSKDLVAEIDKDGVAVFRARDARQLQTLFDDSVTELKKQQQLLADELPSLLAAQKSSEPKIRFFEGSDGIKQLLKDLLWYDDITLKSVWPHTQMSKLLDDEFIRWFEKRRVRNGVTIKALWPHSAKKKKSTYDEFHDGVTRKYLDKGLEPDMSYIIYDNKVAFISSQKEAFGFIVESDEFTHLQAMQFDLLWTKSKN